MFNAVDSFNVGYPNNMFVDRKEKHEYDTVNDAFKHLHTPITTSTSVLAVTFDSGVVIAADILGSYGSLARFNNCNRIMKVNKNIILGVGGDYADFQYLQERIEGKIIGEECLGDGLSIKPAALHCWITRFLYNRRSKIEPLWTNVVIGGIQDGKPFLGAVDKLGTAFVDKHIATGYGAYIAIPLLRDALESKPSLSEEEAVDLIKKCLKVLYYRDARSFKKYELGIITAEKSEVKGPFEIEADWSVAHYRPQ